MPDASPVPTPSPFVEPTAEDGAAVLPLALSGVAVAAAAIFLLRRRGGR